MLQKWRSARKRLVLGAQMGLQRRVRRWHPSDVDEDTALRAKEILEQHTLTEVQEASLGTAIFYTWVSTSLHMRPTWEQRSSILVYIITYEASLGTAVSYTWVSTSLRMRPAWEQRDSILG